MILDAGYPVTTMVIVTNTNSFSDVDLDTTYGKTVQSSDVIMTAVPQNNTIIEA